MIEVFKVQRPLHTNEPVPLALIYNQSRKIMRQVPFTDVASLFKRGELKVYARGQFDDKGEFKCEQVVGPKPW